MSAEDIGKKIGVTGASIIKKLRRWGITVRDKGYWMSTDRNPTKGKGHADATKNKIREAAQKQFSDPKNRELASHNQCLYLAKNLVANISGVEDRVAAELDKRGVVYQRQVPIRNPQTGLYGACVDFMIDGVVVEVNGTYWHSDPRVYPNGPESKSQRKTASNYKRKVELLRTLGIKMIELWEMDVDKDIEKSVTEILAQIDRKEICNQK
jgi:G:T-mismatch repair DNA endonuclease (very short patch repair protein)